MPMSEKENVIQPLQQQAAQPVLSDTLNHHSYFKDEKIDDFMREPEKPVKPPKPRKPKNKNLQEVQNTLGYEDQFDRRFLDGRFPIHPNILHKPRDQLSEFGILYEFLQKGNNLHSNVILNCICISIKS